MVFGFALFADFAAVFSAVAEAVLAVGLGSVSGFFVAVDFAAVSFGFFSAIKNSP